MNTQTAYHEYLVTAQQNADYMNTLLWIFFVFVVIAPLLLVLIYIPVAIFSQPKCPNCGSRKAGLGFQVTKAGDTTTSKRVHICTKCKTEF